MYKFRAKHLLSFVLAAMAVLLVGQAAAAPARVRPQTAQWQLIGHPGGGVADIDVDPSNPQRLYATTTDGVYRSTDGGASWDLSLEGYFRETAVDPRNGDILYTGPQGDSYRYGVFKSTDGGDSWTRYDEGMTCINMATLSIAASDPDTLFTGSF